MPAFLRYTRLWFSFARFALLGELAFRANFLLKMTVEVLWLCILLLFYETIFNNTRAIADWDKNQFHFFVGCYFALEGSLETLFLENCQDFSNQVRTGQLDTTLLQPLDEQFLITCRKIDWSTVPNVLMGAGVMIQALLKHGERIGVEKFAVFPIVFVCALLLAYSFLLLLTSSAVWMVRNQSLMELWWLFSSLMRYPREIFRGSWWADPIGKIFTFLLPVMLIVHVPASVMVKTLDWHVIFVIAATVVMLAFSRWFFRRALLRYRSASS